MPRAIRLLACLLGALALGAAPAAGAPALHVIPFPATPDASPLSHIIFSSLRPSQIRSVIVTGSRSGPHTGHLHQLPDHAGSAFIPNQPFTPGERVTVSATLTSPAAGSASGDPGATHLNYSFTIALPPRGGDPDAHTAAADRWYAYGTRSPASGKPTQSFHSAPQLHPPPVTATSDPDTTSGDIFLTPTYSAQDGAMILDSQGRLVWFHHTDGFAEDLRVQRYRGKPVLTFWEGKSFGLGYEVIMNTSYRIVRVLHAAEGYAADVHEFELTSRGTAFIDASPSAQADLAGIGGSSTGEVRDYVIQELDVKTGQLLWEWHALGHVPLSDSYAGTPSTSGPYDYFHLNSIQQLPDGNLLVSARNTWGLYEVDKKTGHVIWRLGGRRSSFHMGRGTSFAWQHDARLVGTTLSLFDDGSAPQVERQSSAKVLRLNLKAMRVSLVRRYTHSPPLLAAASGSAQILPNHHMVVGWGNQPQLSEYASRGRQIFNASLPLGEYSYRVYRFRWSAQPATRPALAIVHPRHGNLRLYASWNGATQVAAWRVLAGGRRGSLRPLGRFARRGFETMIVLHAKPRYVAVQALDRHGRVLRASRPRAA